MGFRRAPIGVADVIQGLLVVGVEGKDLLPGFDSLGNLAHAVAVQTVPEEPFNLF